MPSTPALLTAFTVATLLAMSLVLWMAQGGQNEDGLLIVVFPPAASEGQIMSAIANADGTFVRSSLPKTIVIAHSDQPGLEQRLKASGAWLTYSQAPFGGSLAGCMALAAAPYEPADWRSF
ncbi:MAG: hypothetical protein KI785_07240 [Devosiaceae bacterium]|nr:hypothetical protein [Devosiaceae bacterium MH13]